jgi:hypothetical protein
MKILGLKTSLKFLVVFITRVTNSRGDESRFLVWIPH